MNPRTIGISPKVIIPFILQLIGACVLYVMGEHDLAVGIIGTAITTGIAGYVAPVGTVLEYDEIDSGIHDLP